jgi:hypothetical protein
MSGGKVPQEGAQDTKGASLTLTPPLRPVKVRSLKDAKRLLSRLIVQLQSGQVKGSDAKDLTYLLSVFLQLVRDHELEQRIKRIEQTIGGKND